MNAARREWGRLKAIEIEREIEKTRRNWDEELAKIVEQAEQTAVEKAKDEWLKEQDGKNRMSDAREGDLAKAVTEAKQEWEREKVMLSSSVCVLHLVTRLCSCNMQLSDYNFTSVTCEKNASSFTPVTSCNNTRPIRDGSGGPGRTVYN